MVDAGHHRAIVLLLQSRTEGQPQIRVLELQRKSRLHTEEAYVETTRPMQVSEVCVYPYPDTYPDTYPSPYPYLAESARYE